MSEEQQNTAPEQKPQIDFEWFRRRQKRVIAAIVIFVVVFELMARYCNFGLLDALIAIPTAFVWMAMNFIPTARAFSYFPTILYETFTTVLDSVAATMIAAVIGLLLAIIGSRSIGVESGIVRGIVRVFASIIRNVPIIAWAMILLLSFKQSEFTGFMALFLTTFGRLTRFFIDTIDEIPSGPIEALQACGASWWQIVFQGGIPLAVSELMSWLLYTVETNIRSATLIGLLTGTGIGFIFDLYYRSFRYDCAGLVVFVTIAVVLVIEAISNKARRAMI